MQRGRYAALPQLGSPVGTLMSSGAFALVLLLPDETFDSWGWRLPFLAAFPLLANEEGRRTLRRYFEPYLRLAAQRIEVIAKDLQDDLRAYSGL